MPSGDPFTASERRRASHVGYLKLDPVTGELRGSISMLGSATSLIIAARPDASGAAPRYAVLARHGDTPEQKALKRKEDGR